jgi:hypothetical protein
MFLPEFRAMPVPTGGRMCNLCNYWSQYFVITVTYEFLVGKVTSIHNGSYPRLQAGVWVNPQNGHGKFTKCQLCNCAVGKAPSADKSISTVNHAISCMLFRSIQHFHRFIGFIQQSIQGGASGLQSSDQHRQQKSCGGTCQS